MKTVSEMKTVSVRTSRRWAGTGALALGAVLATTGCGSGAQPPPAAASAAIAPVAAPATTGPQTTQAPGEPEDSGSPAAPGGTVGTEDLRRAGEAALKAVPDSTLSSIESKENGRFWEVQVVAADGTEHELDVEAGTGKVIGKPRVEAEDAGDKAEHRRRVEEAKLGYLQAAKKIEAQVPGGRITELSLDGHNGKTVWEGDVVDSSRTKRFIMIDAGDGKILVGR
ncbi:PepSY domain-containing protein [Streptosporangium roseum]|uniref:PepSY domain-containing protein n=1 Tax=Streptosporangium roseum TaxID=2001 RepID=UPI0009DD0B7F|nr:PepSY domain-containing protein [Streptosporangium roseum]